MLRQKKRHVLVDGRLRVLRGQRWIVTRCWVRVPQDRHHMVRVLLKMNLVPT